MQHRFYYLWSIILTIFLLSLGGVDRPFGGACQMGGIFPPSSTIPPDAEPDFRLIAEAWNEIQRSYVGKKSADTQAMTYGAISGMVDSLGDTEHSRFLTPEMVRQEKNLTQGKLEGIGAEVQKKNNQIIIVTPMDGSPAQKAGLKPGDVILKVDGEEVAGQPLEQAVSRILGPAGTKVRLTVQSPRTGESKEVNLIRGKISLRNVVWQRLPGTQIAHLRIASFSVGVGKKLKKALKAIEREGIRGVILDLRNNPGGLFGEAIEVASQFMDQGTVVLERNAEGKIKPIPVESGAIAPTLPLVVLVNGGSASAAEIVAGALQDSQRAKLVGEKTFGTGTVLENFPLSDGSALLLATMEWLTPAGRTIWHRGIFPDIILRLPPDVNPLFPDGEKNMTETDLQSSGDAQILKALTLLLP